MKRLQTLASVFAARRGAIMALGSILLGALAVLAHAPFFIWPLFPLLLAPMVWRLDGAAMMQKPKRAGFWRGWLFGTGYFLAGLYWIGSAFVARGPEFVPFLPIAILALAGGLALFWGAAGAIYVWLKPSGISRGVFFAGLFALTEMLRGHILSGLPWNLSGYIFEGGGAISQSASLFGVYGLSLLAWMMTGAVAILADGSAPIKHRLAPLAVTGTLLAGLFVWGSMRTGGTQIEMQPDVRLRVVQANIPQAEKNDFSQREAIIDKYIGLSTAQPLDGITHIVWPEAAIPTRMLEDGYLLDQLSAAFSGGPVLLTGFNRAENVGRADVEAFNSFGAFTFTPDGGLQYASNYDKAHLVPFGEYIPGSTLIQRLNIPSLSTMAFSMTPGPEARTVAIPGAPPASPQICYEIIFPGFTPRGQDRPDWIINVSNDSWFGNSTGPRQHFNQARYRAIEEGLPVVRSASSGFSGTLDPFGRDVAVVSLDADVAVDGGLPKPIMETPYSKWRDYPIFLFVFGLLSLIAFSNRTRMA